MSQGADDPESRAEELQDDLLNAQRMTRAAQDELFLHGSRRVAPSLFVEAAEGKPIFRGLNGTRGLIEPLRRAVLAMVQHPERVDRQYRAMLPEPERARLRPQPAAADPQPPGPHSAAADEERDWLELADEEDASADASDA